MNVDTDEIRQRAVAEVLELGEMLFDTAIEMVMRQPVEGEEEDALLAEEMRLAADEFFTALRLLMRIENSGSIIKQAGN